MALGHDATFAYWNASMAESPMPGVVLKYTPQGWRLSVEDMRVASISKEQVQEAVEESKRFDASMDKEYPDYSEVFHVSPPLWTVMLNMIYAGHAADAWTFVDKVWPEGKEYCDQTEDGSYLTKAEFIENVKKQLRTSPYWKDLQLLNQGQAL